MTTQHQRQKVKVNVFEGGIVAVATAEFRGVLTIRESDIPELIERLQAITNIPASEPASEQSINDAHVPGILKTALKEYDQRIRKDEQENVLKNLDCSNCPLPMWKRDGYEYDPDCNCYNCSQYRESLMSQQKQTGDDR